MLAHSFDGEVEAANCTDVLGKPAALRLSAKFENLKREAVERLIVIAFIKLSMRTCEVLGQQPQGHYLWLDRPKVAS